MRSGWRLGGPGWQLHPRLTRGQHLAPPGLLLGPGLAAPPGHLAGAGPRAPLLRPAAHLPRLRGAQLPRPQLRHQPRHAPARAPRLEAAALPGAGPRAGDRVGVAALLRLHQAAPRGRAQLPRLLLTPRVRRVAALGTASICFRIMEEENTERQKQGARCWLKLKWFLKTQLIKIRNSRRYIDSCLCIARGADCLLHGAALCVRPRPAPCCVPRPAPAVRHQRGVALLHGLRVRLLLEADHAPAANQR